MVVTQQKRAVGVFAEPEKAEQAIQELKASNFPVDHISIVARDAKHTEPVGDTPVSDRIGDTNVQTATAVVANTANNSAMASVLVGLTSLAIPGIGPVIAAGTVGAAMVATVAGMGAGAIAANHLVNALTDLGIPEEQARVYGDRLHGGHYLVILDGTEDEIQRATSVLNKYDIQNWNVYEQV
ncbi:MAG TPA: general stress protein [Crinalium sp.]